MIYATPISGDEYPLQLYADLVVATRPRPQPRPRTVRHGGVVRTYSNGKLVAGMKRDIICAWKDLQLNSVPGRDEPILLSVEIGIPVKDKRRHGQLHLGRPDEDNVMKAVKDALINAGALHDDSQIAAVEAVKRYCAEPGSLKIRMFRIGTPDFASVKSA